MASTAPSGAAAAGAGGGCGSGGSGEQPKGPKRSRLNDVISTVAREVAPFVGGSHKLNADLYQIECRGSHPYDHHLYDNNHPYDHLYDISLLAVFKRHRFERQGAIAASMRKGEFELGWCLSS